MDIRGCSYVFSAGELCAAVPAASNASCPCLTNLTWKENLEPLLNCLPQGREVEEVTASCPELYKARDDMLQVRSVRHPFALSSRSCAKVGMLMPFWKVHSMQHCFALPGRARACARAEVGMLMPRSAGEWGAAQRAKGDSLRAFQWVWPGAGVRH